MVTMACGSGSVGGHVNDGGGHGVTWRPSRRGGGCVCGGVVRRHHHPCSVVDVVPCPTVNEGL